MNLFHSMLGKALGLAPEITLVIVALTLSLFSNILFADSLRCGTRIVQPKDKKISVLEACGEPMAKDAYCKPVNQGINDRNGHARGTTVIVTPCETVEEWSYKPGAGKFIKILLFERGELVSITNGDRDK